MDFSDLVHCISEVNTELTKQAVKAVNRSLTLRNWLIGYYIREFEQHGSDRALYGESLLDLIAARLSDTSDFQPVLSDYIASSIWYIRTFGKHCLPNLQVLKNGNHCLPHSIPLIFCNHAARKSRFRV